MSIAIRQKSASGRAWTPLAVVNVMSVRSSPSRCTNWPMPALVACNQRRRGATAGRSLTWPDGKSKITSARPSIVRNRASCSRVRDVGAAHLAEHEADDTSVDLGDLRGVRVAPDVVRGPLLPDLRPVAAGDLLVDAADPLNVQLVHRPDADAGRHRREGASTDPASYACASWTTSIFFICSIAFMTRPALAGSLSLNISVRTRGTTCHDTPNRTVS